MKTMPRCTNCGSTAQVKHLTGGAWMCGCGQLFWHDEPETPAPPATIQKDLEALYWRVAIECPKANQEIDNILNAFQALSEIIEFAGGGQHKDYL